MSSDRYLQLKFNRFIDEVGKTYIIAFKHENLPIVLIKKLENGEIVYNFFETSNKLVLMCKDWELLIKKGESI